MAALKALAALMAMAAVAELAAGKTYSIDWSNGVDYADWSSKNPVRVGDSVVFTYGTSHTVDELSEPDYKACSFGNPVSSESTGSTTVTFNKAGTRYFACATAGHCGQGQKVAIEVAAAANAPTGSAPGPKDGPPRGNSAAPAGSAGFAVKVALGLGIGGAVLVAF